MYNKTLLVIETNNNDIEKTNNVNCVLKINKEIITATLNKLCNEEEVKYRD